MRVFTDSIEYAERLLLTRLSWHDAAEAHHDTVPVRVREAFFGDAVIRTSEWSGSSAWRSLFIVREAPCSQFDVITRLNAEEVPLSDALLAVAGTGSGFHGFKHRPWVSLEGNIHLVAHFTPQRTLTHPGVGLTVVAATAVLEALDTLLPPEHAPSIKWVNDVIVGGAKVAGVLARLQTMGDRVLGATVGIGLNVETSPEVARDDFVPHAAALREFTSDRSCSLGSAFAALQGTLADNYRRYLAGEYPALLDLYRERSAIMGREVIVYHDSLRGPGRELARGRVISIGDDLELYLERVFEPITTGRLVLTAHRDGVGLEQRGPLALSSESE